MTLATRLGQLLAPAAARWIVRERDRFAAAAEPLGPETKEQLADWFDQNTLDRALIVHAGLATPMSATLGDAPRTALRAATRLWGRVTGARDQVRLVTPEAAAAMTFDRVIVFNEERCARPPPLRLLVHELVHVAQYDRLGVAGFAQEYLGGWIDVGYDYRSIPLEAEAYGVERDFAARADGDAGA